ncbi:MAG: cytochrome-c peroxidase [Phycisphaerae bacterium]|nr:cytochrome-c peroxidase [Phycisphaerae bacterium]
MTAQRRLGLFTLAVMLGLAWWSWRSVHNAGDSGRGGGVPEGATEGAAAPLDLPKPLAVHTQARAPIQPDPTNRLADDANAVALGERLFFDESFSASGTVSCATCHDPQRAFTDGVPVAQGEGLGGRNTPTVLGAARRRWFTWDGRADTIWSQAAAPIEHPAEHGFDRTRLAVTIRDDPGVRRLWETAVGALPKALDAVPVGLAARPAVAGERLDAAPVANWSALAPEQRAAINLVFSVSMKALGAFQRTLDMPLSSFDRWADAVGRGRVSLDDPEAGGIITPAARRGWLLFSGKANCIQCHGGREFTDGEFHNLGLPGPDGRIGGDPGRRKAIAQLKSDPFSSAGEFSDDRDGAEARLVRSLKDDPETWGQFRTPSLRGVALTAPYMHDGRFATLAEVIAFYDTLEGALALDHHREAVLQPLGLSSEERADLEAFLHALTPETIPGAPEPAGTLEGSPEEPPRVHDPVGAPASSPERSPQSSPQVHDSARSSRRVVSEFPDPGYLLRTFDPSTKENRCA